MLLIILVSIILSIPQTVTHIQRAKITHSFWIMTTECFWSIDDYNSNTLLCDYAPSLIFLCVHQQINVVFMVIALATVFKTKYRSVARRRKTKDLDSGDSPNLDLFKYATDYVIIYVGQVLWPVPLSCTFLGHCLLLLWSCFQCWEWLGYSECLQSTPTQLCLPGSSQSSTHFKYA